MGIRSTLASILSAPVAALLESRVRELAEAAIDDRDLADPASVRELSIQVERTRGAVEQLRADVERCRTAVTQLAELGEASGEDDLAVRVAGLVAQDEEISTQLAAAQERLQALGDQVLALRTSLDAAPARTTAAAKPRKAAPKATSLPPEPGEAGDRGCKVPGCDGKHRARGFCGRHYQMWKRGTLAGFVNEGGTVLFEGDARRWQVDPSLAGEPAALMPRGVKVGGKRIPAQRSA